MIPYTELTRTGKLRRLRRLAETALAQYELPGASLVYHQFDTNLLYRVRVPGRQTRYVLRLATPGWRTLRDLESEALWLDALARDTDIPVPRVQRTRAGRSVVPIEEPGVPDPWNATLMTWLPGTLLGRHLTESNIRTMGELFGQMHVHGKQWKPPAGFTTRVFDGFLSRGEPNVVLEQEQRVELEGDTASTLGRLMESVDLAYSALDPDDLRVIHCDLWHDNIKVHRGRLCPFDFEDTIWGFRIHDIAMAMLDLLEDTDNDRYAILYPAFREGYASVLPWPGAEMEIFQIGRLLWKINWVARYEREWLRPMVERHVPVFRTFEETGRVMIPPGPS